MEQPDDLKQGMIFEKIIDLVAWFLGSWLGVVLHTIIFCFWLILGLDLEILLVAVSLEAIYIGIFLLMAANEEERKKKSQDKILRERDRQFMLTDIKLDEKASIALAQIVENQKEIRKQLTELRKKA